VDRVLRYEIVRRGRRAALPNKAFAVTDMEIKRINTYTDSRFSQAALNQHGCFLVDGIQPSQFFVDEDKLSAISSFIQKETDIIIQIIPYQDRYVSVDGHTRLYYASMKGWHMIRAVISESEDWVHRFVKEAGRRGIHKPDDLVLLKHEEYEEKWNQFCEELLKEKKG